MPAYHSGFLEDKQAGTLAGFLTPTIAQKSSFQPEGGDIIDEAIMLFRPNAYFRSFEIRGPADRTLAYLLLFIGDCLGKLKAGLSRTEAQSQLGLWASSAFAVPGDSNFQLKAMFPEAKTRQETDQLREFLVKLRVETASRLLAVIYAQDAKEPSQWWMAFQKRKFMGKTLN